jgi:hypothetical protein
MHRKVLETLPHKSQLEDCSEGERLPLENESQIAQKGDKFIPEGSSGRGSYQEKESFLFNLE